MTASKDIRQFLQQNLARHAAFFRRTAPGPPLIMAECPDDEFARDYRYGTQLSEEVLRQHAYDLGVRAVRNALVMARLQEKTGGHRCPGVFHNWGTGFTTALITGGDIIFEKSTTYTTGPVLQHLDEVARLTFNPDNRWMHYLVSFWRGVASENLDGLVVASHAYRSPLDLACDMRGQDLFTDFYDAPEAVERLLQYCMDSMVAVQRILEDRVPLLRSHMGGVWGVALKPRLMFINGDPADLVSAEIAQRFDSPWIARLCDYAGAIYYHHHSIGVSRANAVSRIRGLMLQQILQDPNGPRLEDWINDELIDASLRTPIHLGMNLAQCERPESIVERLSRGRFIIEANARSLEHARQLMELVCHTAGAC